MRYLCSTFSPAMLKSGVSARVAEVGLQDVKEYILRGCDSAVGHEVTAHVLTVLLGFDVPFARVNLTLGIGDEVMCVIPNFRAPEAREFTRNEVELAGYRCFHVVVDDLR